MPQDNVGNIREEALEPLKVYWQPGCSSCLKTKEFLLEHGVAFQSVNVLEDDSGFEELRALGLKLVPIVARGKNWANGAVFRDVARVAGFEYGGHKMLPPEEIEIMTGCPELLTSPSEEALKEIKNKQEQGIHRLVVPLDGLLPEMETNILRFGEEIIKEAQ